MNEELVRHFAEIEPAEIKPAEISKFSHEGDFVEKCVELLIEAGSYLICAASIYPSGAEGWDRNQAVIGGSLVRMYKLIDAVLDQTCRHRLETTFIFSRLLFETTVNTIYLMQNPDSGNFSDFVSHSLQFENRLLKKIELNIEQRNGVRLPIEERMIESAERMFRLSGVQRSSLPNKRRADWQGRNLFQRAEDIGLEEAYLGIFANASNIVHGNWGDLYAHHLEPKGDRFIAKTSFKPPRPQPLEVNAILSVRTVGEFIGYLGLFQERLALQKLFDDFETRVQLLSKLHEDFLNGDP